MLVASGVAQAQIGEYPGVPGEPSQGRHVADEILVKYKPSAGNSQITAFESGTQASWRSTGWHGQVRRLRIHPGSSVKQALAKFRSNPLVEYAEPNFIAETSATPTDPMYWLQWNMLMTTV